MQKCSLAAIVNASTVSRECTELVDYFPELSQEQSFINTQIKPIYHVHIGTGDEIDSSSVSRTAHKTSTCMHTR